MCWLRNFSVPTEGILLVNATRSQSQQQTALVLLHNLQIPKHTPKQTTQTGSCKFLWTMWRSLGIWKKTLCILGLHHNQCSKEDQDHMSKTTLIACVCCVIQHLFVYPHLCFCYFLELLTLLYSQLNLL